MFVVVIVLGQAALSVVRVRALEDRREAFARESTDPVAAVLANAGRNTSELASFREVVAPTGGRFAVAFGEDVTADERRRILLVTGRTFLPATGVGPPAQADYLVAIGAVPPSARVGFERVAAAHGAWLGRRAR